MEWVFARLCASADRPDRSPGANSFGGDSAWLNRGLEVFIVGLASSSCNNRLRSRRNRLKKLTESIGVAGLGLATSILVAIATVALARVIGFDFFTVSAVYIIPLGA